MGRAGQVFGRTYPPDTGRGFAPVQEKAIPQLSHETREKRVKEAGVHGDKRRRGMKRGAAVEPSIGHLKQGHRMDKNRLKGEGGDRINAVMSAAGRNFFELLRTIEATFLRLLYHRFGYLFSLSGFP